MRFLAIFLLFLGAATVSYAMETPNDNDKPPPTSKKRDSKDKVDDEATENPHRTLKKEKEKKKENQKEEKSKEEDDEEEYKSPLNSSVEDELSSSMQKASTKTPPKKINKKSTLPPSSDPGNLNKSKKLEEIFSLKNESGFRYSVTRKTDKQNITNIYFHKNYSIKWNECILHDFDHYSSDFNKINIINALWVEEAKKGNANFNHLSCNIFCILRESSEEDSKPTIYESPIFVKGIQNSKHYNFSITKNGEKKNGLLFADFVSSAPVHSKGSLKNKEFIAVEKDTHILPKDQKITNHGDLLALYTLKTNQDLFFKLIRKRGHRNDYEILSFGVRFFSSLDACENCNQIIYDTIYSPTGLRSSIFSQIEREDYTTDYKNETLPFHTLFYSYRPYTHGDRKPKYLVAESISMDDSPQEYETTASWSDLDRINQNHTYELKTSSGNKTFKANGLIVNSDHSIVDNSWKTIYSNIALFDE